MTQDEGALDVKGNERLCVITRKVSSTLKSGASVDRQQREAARARMRIPLKSTFRRYDYPPDLQDAAV